MILYVNRFVSDEETTISQLYINGRFFCFGLEDEFRTIKIKGETRIPAGIYKIGVRTEGEFNNRYHERFGTFHQGMLHIKDVPGFEWILIHCGNKDTDTAGCLLVGDGAVTTINDMMITNSVNAYKRLYNHVIEEAKKDNLQIQIIDTDR